MTYTIIGADGGEYGPITADQLRQWIAEGRANAQTRVKAEGATEWKPLIEYLEFASALSGRAAPMPTPMPPGSPIPTTIGPIPTAPRNNPMAVAGMIMGIISVTVAICCCYGLPFNVLAIIFSLVGLSQIKADPYNQRGRGMAIAGLVLGIVSLLLAAVVLAFGLAMGSADLLQQLQKS